MSYFSSKKSGVILMATLVVTLNLSLYTKTIDLDSQPLDASLLAYSKDGEETRVEGTYRCWSMNVGGRGGKCSATVPLILYPDGTYTFSKEKGTYHVKNQGITLSESRFRGAGKWVDGNKIVFNYTYKGLKQTITYLRRGPAPEQKNNSAKKTTVVKKEPQTSTEDNGTGGWNNTELVAVNVTLEYNKKDSSLGWINTVTLVPKGYKAINAPHRPEALAIWDGNKTINVYFREVMNQKIYQIYTGNGFEGNPVGTIDLRKNKKQEVQTNIQVNSEESKPATPPTSVPENTKTTQPEDASLKSGKRCDPNVPLYTQQGCIQ